MPKRKYNFTSINIPPYLVKDIDSYINSDSNLRGLTTRAGFIGRLADEFLDKKAAEKEKDIPKDKKSARAKRHELVEWFDNLKIKDVNENQELKIQFQTEYEKLTEQIEKKEKKIKK